MTWGTWPYFQSSVEKYYLILEYSIFETGHDLLARRYVCTAAGGAEDIANDHTNCKDRLASQSRASEQEIEMSFDVIREKIETRCTAALKRNSNRNLLS